MSQARIVGAIRELPNVVPSVAGVTLVVGVVIMGWWT